MLWILSIQIIGFCWQGEFYFRLSCSKTTSYKIFSPGINLAYLQEKVSMGIFYKEVEKRGANDKNMPKMVSRFLRFKDKKEEKNWPKSF